MYRARSAKGTKKTRQYQRPAETYTDTLTDEQIKAKLENYIKVTDISALQKDTHIRYYNITMDKGSKSVKKEFRMGGFLLQKGPGPDPAYIVLTNGYVNWSVQTKDAVLYRKMTVEEVKDQYDGYIDQLKEANGKLYQQNKKFKELLKKNNIDYHK